MHQVQHEHGLTLGQRMVYFLACLANTAAMLTTTLVFVMAILLPCATYVGRYHIMLLVILGAAVLGVATLVSVGLALAGLDTSLLSADRWFWFKEYTGWFFNCSAQISVLKRKMLFNQRGSFVHREFHGTESLIGCLLFFILVLKIGRNS